MSQRRYIRNNILLISSIGFFYIARMFVYGESSYNGYGGYTVGDTRIVSMGGASLAVSEDINGVIFNPAGIVNKSFGYGLSFSGVYNYPTDLNNDGKKDGIPLEYWYLGLVFSLGKKSNFFSGIVFTGPYEAVVDIDNPQQDKLYLGLKIKSISIPIARKLSEKSAIGVVFNFFDVREEFQYVSYSGFAEPLEYYQKTDNGSIDLGWLYCFNEKWTLGAVVKPSVKFDFDETMNEKLYDNYFKWFRDVVIPMRLGVGVAYRPSSRIIIVADTNYIGGQKDSVLIGSNLIPDLREYKMRRKGRVDFHLGSEIRFPVKRSLEFKMRFGCYYEPSRIDGVAKRFHKTFGGELQIWRIILGTGVDIASDFGNLSTQIGVKLFNY